MPKDNINEALPRGIRRRGTKYLVDCSHKGQRLTATCDSVGEAIDTKARMIEGLQTGKDVKPKRRANATAWTIQRAFDKTAAMPRPEGWRGCSYEKQAHLNAQAAIDFFGPDKLLEEITRDDVDRYFAALEARGNSDSTINRKRSALSKLARVALDYGGMTEPLKMPRQRKEPVGRIRQISAKEEQVLLQWLRTTGQDDMADAVTVLIDTGMRRGELLNLRPTDVDLETGVCMVYGTEGQGTKNGRIRSVPMTARVRAILSERQIGAACFDLSPSGMRHAWDTARAHMGLMGDKDFTLHVCRHTCASRLVSKGVSLPVVQQWLGHTAIQTTMRYSHLYPSDLMNAVKALED